ncbi:DUF5060 domain-containing protein [Algisphaera agarilytica]|uniref:DUF5060 domain-containing protein n=1 Tax=Algisphaera agarilytica TaxID=1385975 RepID=A0A7X0LJQ2_9BACT|nr:DUF5060 domain-containing protein [Algisphaera agarilytica]MBB6429077.1 hypothetical protein [Algisphaera agarilytica]
MQKTFLARRAAAVGSVVALVFGMCGGQALAQVTGNLTQWQPIEVTFSGPSGLSEVGGNNPFLNYRLQVQFTSNGKNYDVPGFFDGVDSQGNSIWKARFTPDQAGSWDYTASFRSGTNVAVSLDANAGTATSFNGANGSFNIAARDANAPGFMSRGRLAYTGNHYLQTLGDGKYWIKTGIDSPENFLAYRGFDNSQTKGNSSGFAGRPGILHNYAPHAGDYNAGDPTWDTPDFNFGNSAANGGDARNIIGYLNYLETLDLPGVEAGHAAANSIYFLPNNIGGDGKDVNPYANLRGNLAQGLAGETNVGGSNDNTRFDISKLEQWNTVFQHAQEKGIKLHFVLNEAEFANKRELDDGTLGNERKLYYRELVARFGHHNALQWNMSEEYEAGSGFGGSTAEEAARIQEFAEYLSTIDPYDHPVTVHQVQHNNFETDPRLPNSPYRFFYGDDNFDTTSLQRPGVAEGWSNVVEAFRRTSAEEGRPWVVQIDEPESITRMAVGVNDNTESGTTNNERFNTVRKTMMYDILFSGGGVEWFIHNADQDVEDQRIYEKVYRESYFARKFLEENTPFWLMDPDDELVRGDDSDYGGAEVFALVGDTYAIYLPDGSNDDNGQSADDSPELNLTLYDAMEFELRWYNPRTGLFEGAVVSLEGGDWAALGYTPDGRNNVNDWVALVTLIPEPGTGTLAVIAGLALLRRREQA